MTVYELAASLPDLVTLRRRCRALAILEAIISPDWEYRYYSFNSCWSTDVALGSMRNGSGEEYSIVFDQAGVFIRGFDHEAPMTPGHNDDDLWPGVIEGIPNAFLPYVNEPAFSYDGQLSATFCLWRQRSDGQWRTGVINFPPFTGSRIDPDGSGLLDILCDPTPDAYLAYAADIHEIEPDPGAVAHIWASLPLTEDVVVAIHPDRHLSDLAADLAEIGEDRELPEALALAHALGFDYRAGDGVDFEPYGEFSTSPRRRDGGARGRATRRWTERNGESSGKTVPVDWQRSG